MTGSRIPFALVGVVLLVGSASYAGSLQTPAVSESRVDDALDGTAAELQSAVRDGVETAAHDAARDPVTQPANTTAGAVVNESSPFRDSLRIRVYLAVRDRVRRLSGTEGDRTVTATLPATATPDALRAAKRRVTVEPANTDGTELRATIENVTLTARRDGRVVGTRTLSPTVTVPVPVLFVHDRVQTFEQRLNAGPTRPGLGRRLTAAMYALTWLRGYAQFGGAAIENVVANRHIGLVTNGAVLSMQRDFFGAHDKRGASILAWDTANTALTDAIDSGRSPTAEKLSKIHDKIEGERVPSVVLQNDRSETLPVAPNDTTTIHLNETADRAFLAVTDSLEQQLTAPYNVDIKRETAVVQTRRVLLDRPSVLGENWTLNDVTVRNRTRVRERTGTPRAMDGRWHRLASHPRWVNHTRTVTRTWNTSDGRRTTVERRRTAQAVSITLAGRHTGGGAPLRPIESTHTRGGPLDGPNLVGVESTAHRKLIAEDGGVDSIARETVTARGETVTETVSADTPDGFSAWVYRDLATLRQRVRNLSVSVSRGKLATMQVNPARRLREKLDTRRAELLAVPSSYDGVASRARVGARLAYLEAVATRLDERASGHSDRQATLDNRLSETGVGSIDSLRANYENRTQTSAIPGENGVPMRVQTSPSYLTLGAVSGDRVPGIPSDTSEHPLVARNRNLFTVPYGDLADAVTEGVFEEGQTRLRTAARVLDAGTSLDVAGNETSAVREEVVESNEYLQQTAVETLARIDAAGEQQREGVVSEALARWSTPSARAQALSNGSAADAIQRRARQRWNLSYRRSDRLGLRLERQLDSARADEQGRPSQQPVANHAARLKGLATSKVNSAVSNATKHASKRAIERVTGRSLSQLPSGLPLAPVPPAWYLTVNYWEVDVAGEYARFTVSVPRGTPDDPGGRWLYVRDGNAVRLDVDGDGAAERLGQNARVGFRVQTSVAIAVPPRPRGVGDVDGQMTEPSPGWPTPGVSGSS